MQILTDNKLTKKSPYARIRRKIVIKPPNFQVMKFWLKITYKSLHNFQFFYLNFLKKLTFYWLAQFIITITSSLALYIYGRCRLRVNKQMEVNEIMRKIFEYFFQKNGIRRTFTCLQKLHNRNVIHLGVMRP